MVATKEKRKIGQGTDTPDGLFKYLGFNKIDFIASCETVRFSPPDELNDPFEAYPAASVLAELYKETLEQAAGVSANGADSGLSSIHERLIGICQGMRVWDAFVKSVSRRVGVLSLSGSPCIPLMWSHYADNYSGICVEFKSSSSLISESVYSSFSGPQQVSYSEVRTDSFLGDGGRDGWFIRDVLLRKSPDWAYRGSWLKRVC